MEQVGRYESPEENPFFPENLPPSMVPPHDDPEVSIHLNLSFQFYIYFQVYHRKPIFFHC